MKHSVSADCFESLRSLWAPSVVRRGPAADECERMWNLRWRIDFCVSLRKLAQRLPILISRLHFWKPHKSLMIWHFSLFYKKMETKPCFSSADWSPDQLQDFGIARYFPFESLSKAKFLSLNWFSPSWWVLSIVSCGFYTSVREIPGL